MSEVADHLPTRELAELRLRAEQLIRDEDDQPLLGLAAALRTDQELWAHLWAPGVALAARRLGDVDALALMEEAVAGGFSQPELFDGELERAFGADTAWRELRHRMQTNVPLPRLVSRDAGAP